jgi:hypothetical protein
MRIGVFLFLMAGSGLIEWGWAVPQDRIAITSSGKELTISWQGEGILESKDRITANWAPMPGVGSPYKCQASEGARYFRVWYGVTLRVTKAGNGSGTVASQPAGIDCGASCSGLFARGTQVTLTATPAAGSVFAGWSGDGTGTGTRQVVMDSAKSGFGTRSVSTSTARRSRKMRACATATLLIAGIASVST